MKLRKYLTIIVSLIVLMFSMTGCVEVTFEDSGAEELVEVEDTEDAEYEDVDAEDVDDDDADMEAADESEIEEDNSDVEIQTHYYFRKQSMLDQHYEKHGIEMGFDSAEDYEEAACKVVNNPKSLHKIEAEDGDDIYYVEDTNEFVVVSKDGYIRTYFYPSAGKKYYDRQ